MRGLYSRLIPSDKWRNSPPAVLLVVENRCLVLEEHNNPAVYFPPNRNLSSKSKYRITEALTTIRLPSGRWKRTCGVYMGEASCSVYASWLMNFLDFLSWRSSSRLKAFIVRNSWPLRTDSEITDSICRDPFYFSLKIIRRGASPHVFKNEGHRGTWRWRNWRHGNLYFIELLSLKYST